MVLLLVSDRNWKREIRSYCYFPIQIVYKILYLGRFWVNLIWFLFSVCFFSLFVRKISKFSLFFSFLLFMPYTSCCTGYIKFCEFMWKDLRYPEIYKFFHDSFWVRLSVCLFELWSLFFVFKLQMESFELFWQKTQIRLELKTNPIQGGLNHITFAFDFAATLCFKKVLK